MCTAFLCCQTLMCAGVTDHFESQVRAHLDTLCYWKGDTNNYVIISNKYCSVLSYL
jgi:hypothetical protein